MLHRPIIWGAIVALLLMGSGAMQWAHDATAHSVVKESLTHCHAPGSLPVPAPQDKHDCDICHLISHFSITVPVTASLSLPGEPIAFVACVDMRVALASQHRVAGPRAPPVAM